MSAVPVVGHEHMEIAYAGANKIITVRDTHSIEIFTPDAGVSITQTLFA
jgi:hypothetical protein